MSSHVIARIAVEIEGAGDPVLMIHGLGGTSNTFQPQMSVLAGRYRVLRPDLPGSGRSAVPESLSIGAMVASLAALCAAAGVASAHVLGHSLGTILAQHLAVEHPSLVRSLCLLGALSEPPDLARANQLARAKTARAEGMGGIADQVSSTSLSATTKANNPAAVAFVRESLMRQPADGYALTCEALAAARAADLRSVRVPILCITGADDPVAPPSVARQIAEQTSATADILSQCGHWPSIEQAGEVNRRLAAFLMQRPR